MKANDYKNECLKTESNNFDEIKKRVTEDNIRLLHACLGMQTECAEFTDVIKKHLFYNKPLDIINLKEELFDCCWYMSIALDVLGYSFEEGFNKNIEKLKIRYPEKFNEEKALNRNLSLEKEVLKQN